MKAEFAQEGEGFFLPGVASLKQTLEQRANIDT